MVPLMMALRYPTIRILIADDVGIGKTIEAVLIVREMMDRERYPDFPFYARPIWWINGIMNCRSVSTYTLFP